MPSKPAQCSNGIATAPGETRGPVNSAQMNQVFVAVRFSLRCDSNWFAGNISSVPNSALQKGKRSPIFIITIIIIPYIDSGFLRSIPANALNNVQRAEPILFVKVRL